MQIVWTRSAQADLIAAIDYILLENQSAAMSVLDRIKTGVDRLKRHPNMGRAGRVSGTRELVIPRTPFIVAYRVKVPRIEILAVLHSSRKWPGTL